MPAQFLETYLSEIADGIRTMTVTSDGRVIPPEAGIAQAATLSQATADRGKKLLFVGNGGSASIASHMSQDFTKCGGVRAVCFNDASLLTCLANDYSYAEAFGKAVTSYGDPGDLLIAISSGGRSENILQAVAAARAKGIGVVTLSGFASDNQLVNLGDLNFHVASDRYGPVEIAHLAIIHAWMDWLVHSRAAGPKA